MFDIWHPLYVHPNYRIGCRLGGKLEAVKFEYPIQVKDWSDILKDFRSYICKI